MGLSERPGAAPGRAAAGRAADRCRLPHRRGAGRRDRHPRRAGRRRRARPDHHAPGSASRTGRRSSPAASWWPRWRCSPRCVLASSSAASRPAAAAARAAPAGRAGRRTGRRARPGAGVRRADRDPSVTVGHELQLSHPALQGCVTSGSCTAGPPDTRRRGRQRRRDTEGGHHMRTHARFVTPRSLLAARAHRRLRRQRLLRHQGRGDVQQQRGAGERLRAGRRRPARRARGRQAAADRRQHHPGGQRRGAGRPALLEALNAVSAALDTDNLIALNKAVDIDRQTSPNVAKQFVEDEGLADGARPAAPARSWSAPPTSPRTRPWPTSTPRSSTPPASTPASSQLGNREVYLPALEKGEIHVVPGVRRHADRVPQQGPERRRRRADRQRRPRRDRRGPHRPRARRSAWSSASRPRRRTRTPSPSPPRSPTSTASRRSPTWPRRAAPGLVLGGPPECPERPFCQPGSRGHLRPGVRQLLGLDAGGPLDQDRAAAGQDLARPGLLLRRRPRRVAASLAAALGSARRHRVPAAGGQLLPGGDRGGEPVALGASGHDHARVVGAGRVVGEVQVHDQAAPSRSPAARSAPLTVSSR